jgi:hypothetical protein
MLSAGETDGFFPRGEGVSSGLKLNCYSGPLERLNWSRSGGLTPYEPKNKIKEGGLLAVIITNTICALCTIS